MMTTSVRNRLEDLVRISESTAWSVCPEAVCERTVKVLADVLGCDSAVIYLLDVAGDQLIVSAALSSYRKQDMRLPITAGRIPRMMQTHKPVIMDFQHLHPSDSADRIPEDMRFRSGISVPLLSGDVFLGIYFIFYKMFHHWTEQDIDELLIIGRLLGVSVQHAHTARKAADLEILMERKRLCDELHDNLSQMISTLNLGTEAALFSLEEGNINRLKSDLEKNRGVAQKASRTLREEMLSLRTPTNEAAGLISGIRDCLKRFKEQWGIDTDLQVEEGLVPLIVSTQMELQFMRILHETLSNVMRHATATKVNVLLQGDPNRLYMQIQDNGRGFNPGAVAFERLGLRIMRERAESLGGKLTIGSVHGIGTTIGVDVPR